MAGKTRAAIPEGLEVRRVDLDAIHLDPANVRRHGEKNLDAIIASLRTFGQVEPLVVQKGTGKIIGGNGRYAAMRAIGWDACDVVEVEADGVKATALGVALNRSGELATWDDVGLAETLRALQGEEFDLGAVGFTDDEVDQLINGMGSDMLPAGADGKEYDESVADEVEFHECPSCGHRFPR